MIQTELADLLEVTDGHISRLISGDRRPSVELMAAIKGTLRWSLDSQVAHLDRGDYGSELKRRMDAWNLVV